MNIVAVISEVRRGSKKQLNSRLQNHTPIRQSEECYRMETEEVRPWICSGTQELEGPMSCKQILLMHLLFDKEEVKGLSER